MTGTNHETTQAVGGPADHPIDPSRLKALKLIVNVYDVVRRFVVIVWALAVLSFVVIASGPMLALLQLEAHAWGFACNPVPGGGQWCTFQLSEPVELGPPDGEARP